MASGEEKLEDLLSCPICLEDFTYSGETVPRTLPCPHKLCTGCLKKLLEQVKRECPFCRKVLDKDIRNFPQDKLVIAYLKERKQEKREEKREVNSICNKHGMELILFCRDDKVAICQKCLIESHNRHNLIDIKEMERENLAQRVGTLKSGIAEKKEALDKAKEELVNKADKSVANLKKEKQEVVGKFNDMIKKVEDDRSKEVNEINSALDTLEDIREICDSLSDNTGRESGQELLTKIETLSDIERNVAEHLSGAQDLTYYNYQAPELTAEARCGKISEDTITVDLSKGNVLRDVQIPVPINVPMLLPYIPRPIQIPVPRPVPRGVEVKYKVEKRIPLDFTSCFDVTPLDATSVLVSGVKQNVKKLSRLVRGSIKDVYKLARVNIHTREEIISVDLTHTLHGMATVELGGRKVLALSLGHSKKIEFRDVETLQLISTFSVAPHGSGALCVSSPTTLLYEDWSHRPRQVHTLDCSRAKPKHVGVINTELNRIYDICVVKNGGMGLLVCVGSKVITAQNLRTRQIKWRVDGIGFKENFTPWSLTSDGRGRVITCDGEQNIRTFHVSDGRYLSDHQRALDALREQRITVPFRVRWNSADSSLVVRHEEYLDEVMKNFISVIRVEYKPLEV